tara:strand:- start:389 stop:814 length:426 start_codon:yes stop_codon:yes gene_type:complete
MPSQIKVDEIKNVAGQYKIKTNVFEGQTTAGSITVQGEGSATTNLQQGLAKAWLGAANHSSGAILGDTFNISSYEDTATGRGRPSMTNGVSGDYCCLTSTESQYPYQAFNVSSTQFELSAVGSNASFADGVNNGAVLGDLA